MARPLRLSLALVIAGLGLTACATEPPKPTLSYIDVAQTSIGAAEAVEPGRILSSSLYADHVAYVVQRLRDDSVIQVSQPDLQPLPSGLKVAIRYGSPVRIEATPTTPHVGPPTPPNLG